MSEETTLENARARLRRLGVQVPVLAAAAAVAFGGISTVAPGIAAAAPPPSASSADDDRSIRQKLNELRELAKKGSISSGVRASQLLDAVTKYFPGCVGRCLAEKIAGSGSLPTSISSQLKLAAECVSECYLKRKLKTPDQAYEELLQAKAEEKRARKELRKAKESGADTTKLEENYKKTQAATGKAEKEHVRAVDRHTVAKRVSEYITEQDAAKKRNKNGDDGDAPPQAVKPTKPPKGGPSTTGKTVETPGAKAVAPKVGSRIGRGGGGAAALAILGELAGQKYQEHLSAEHRKMLAKAIEDPKLRKNIVDYYNGYTKDNPFGQIIRPFQKTGFSHGAAMDTAPALIEFQKKLDAQVKLAKDRAARSNADRSYQQASKECRGENTCTTDRTRVLRERARQDKNRDALIADKKAASKPVPKSERQRHIDKQGELDRQSREQFGKDGDKAVKKPKVRTERQRHIDKQGELDRQSREQFGKDGDKAVKKPKVRTERQRHIDKQGELDRKDREQLGTKPVENKTPTGKAGKNNAKKNNPQYQAALKKQSMAA
ncbi:hypothetical protein [Amycolatopsis sp. YIM 10]|uniref:hypothetical protein n=1 Tax=Amycolatopsis sp. YIM 10 TaxID=2653857 RepID=UPI00129069F7|nr:hypothetical protein [Amycolatopsis sp. YIM 10]